MNKDVIIDVNGSQYVFTSHFKEILNSLIDDMKDNDKEKVMRLVKSIISCKYSLLSSVYKEEKVIYAMMYELFDKQEVDDILKAKKKECQKRYNAKHTTGKKINAKYIINKKEVVNE